MKEVSIIDERNEAIWNEINDHFTTEIQVHDRHHYYSFIRENTAFFYIPQENNIELFTHELLHIYLRTQRIFISEWLLQLFKQEPLLGWNCNDNLFEQIGHYLEDIKILTLYLEMGLDRNKFSESYSQLACTHNNIQIIHSGMKKRIPAAASIDMFIHKYFAMKADPNPDNEYHGRMEDLKSINKELFDILDRFYQQWLTFDIFKYDPGKYSYKDFTAAFVHDVGKWMVKTRLLQPAA